jgi:hypothetical protein
MTVEPAVLDVVEDPRLVDVPPTLPIDTLRALLTDWACPVLVDARVLGGCGRLWLVGDHVFVLVGAAHAEG